MTVKRGRILPVLVSVMIVCLFTQAGVAQDSTGLGMVAGVQSLDYCRSVERYGDYYYLSTGTTGFVVLHKEGNTYTKCYQNTDFAEEPTGIFRDGDRILVTGHCDKTIFDISDPANPVLLAEYEVEYDEHVSHNFTYGMTLWRDDVLVHNIMLEDYITIESVSENSSPQLLEVLSPITTARYGATACTESLIAGLEWEGTEYTLNIWDYSDTANVHLVADGWDIGADFRWFTMSDEWLLTIQEDRLCLYSIQNLPDISPVTEWTDEEFPFDDMEFCHFFDDKFVLTTGDEIYVFSITDELTVEQESMVQVEVPFPATVDFYEQGCTWTRGRNLFEFTVINEDPYVEVSGFAYREFYDMPCLYEGNKLLIEDLKLYSGVQEDQLDSIEVLVNGEGKRGTLIAYTDNMGLIQWGDNRREAQLVMADEESELGFSLHGFVPGTTNSGKYIFGQDGWLFFIPLNTSPSYIRSISIQDPDSPSIEDSLELSIPLFPAHRNLVYYDTQCYTSGIYQNNIEEVFIDMSDPYNLGYAVLEDPFGVETRSGYILGYDNMMCLHDNNNECTYIYSLDTPQEPLLLDTVTAFCEIVDYQSPFWLVLDGCMQVFQYDPMAGTEPVLVAEYDAKPVSDAQFLSDDRILATWENGMGLFAFDPTGIHEIEISESLPSQLRLSSYPNPANPETRITLELPQAEAVMVCVYDVLGREVVRLHEGVLHAGSHAFHFGSQPGLSSGVYFVRATAGRWETAQRIVLLK